jgi:hypothetical protein
MKNLAVAWTRWRKGSKLIHHPEHIGPCPICMGNDKAYTIREAPCFALCQCTRCDETYLG